MFRRSLLLFIIVCAVTLLASSGDAADPARLASVDKVYLWPMSSSLDQYLAEQIATEGVFSVVVDPKLAQAILTDRISSKFLEGMEELFPSEQEKAEEAEKEEAEEADAATAFGSAYRPEKVPYQSASHAEGAVFLVDVTSREVLWSTFLKDFDPSPRELHKHARAIVMRLKKSRAVPSP